MEITPKTPRHPPPLPTASSALVPSQAARLFYSSFYPFKKRRRFSLSQRFLYFLGCSRHKWFELISNTTYFEKKIVHYFNKLIFIPRDKFPWLMIINIFIRISSFMPNTFKGL